jgi:hypothetical protein
MNISTLLLAISNKQQQTQQPFITGHFYSTCDLLWLTNEGSKQKLTNDKPPKKLNNASVLI